MKTMKKKPKVKLTGRNGNIFNLGGIAANALVDAGRKDDAAEMRSRIIRSKSYDEALQIIGEYCEVS